MITSPKVVAIGGGHGLAATLRAAASYAGELTGVVSVADDGGSSGRIRDAMGLPAMGDIRRCLSALADPAILLSSVFEHRFDGVVDGDALGNLLIAALAHRTGDFSAAVAYVGELLGASGEIVPATDERVDLHATTAAGEVAGQVAVQRSKGIERVWLEPPRPAAPKRAFAAIAGADQVIIGPGSLFTSVLAALAVPDVRDAVAVTGAQRIYVSNLRPQDPETAGYDVAAHVGALARHGVAVDVVLCHPGALPVGAVEVPVEHARLVVGDGDAHDPTLLGEALLALL